MEYIKNKPSWKNIQLIDAYLQKRGFAQDRIIYIFDASFKYKVDIPDFDAKLEKDQRFCCTPAGGMADGHILAKARELQLANPKFPPFVVSNDSFNDFIKFPELEEIIKTRKRGVIWTYM